MLLATCSQIFHLEISRTNIHVTTCGGGGGRSWGGAFEAVVSRFESFTAAAAAAGISL